MVAGDVDEEEEEEAPVHYSFSLASRQNELCSGASSLAYSLLHLLLSSHSLLNLLLSPSFSPAPASLSHSLLHLLLSLISLAPRENDSRMGDALHCNIHFLFHQHVHYSFSLAPKRCTLFVQSITHLVPQVLCTFEGIGVLPHLTNVLRESARASQRVQAFNSSRQCPNLRGETEARAARRVAGCRASPSSGMNPIQG